MSWNVVIVQVKPDDEIWGYPPFENDHREDGGEACRGEEDVRRKASRYEPEEGRSDPCNSSISD